MLISTRQFFWVIYFNIGREDFEILGAFSKEDDANTERDLIKSSGIPSANSAFVLQGSQEWAINELLQFRLGELAKQLERLTLFVGVKP